MDTRRALLVDAFTADPLAGNAAGVVPDAAGLSTEQMQAVARELGASETAFVLPADAGSGGDAAVGDEGDAAGGASSDSGGADTDSDADRRLRFFTPTREIDLCGHATVAVHAHLRDEGAIDDGETTIATNVGDVDVVVDDGTVWIHQTFESVEPVTPNYDRLGAALGVDPAALRDVGADLAPAVASTGLRYLLVPVNFLEHLSGADPDREALLDISEDLDLTGVYAFTFDTLEAESTLHGRMFAPAAGISEDAVTGTASGACAAYLRYVEAFDGDLPTELRFEQGHFVDRPGYVRVSYAEDGGLLVGGESATALDGELTLPADQGDGDGEFIEA